MQKIMDTAMIDEQCCKIGNDGEKIYKNISNGDVILYEITMNIFYIVIVSNSDVWFCNFMQVFLTSISFQNNFQHEFMKNKSTLFHIN